MMRQLYLNDVEQWIRMMESNLQKSLENLLKICTEVIQKKEASKEQRKEEQYFMLNDQEIVKIFLLCLDLSGEENCSLSIMRSSSSLMQKLLSTVMNVDI